MLNLPNFKLPRFTFRFFIFSLFGLVILILGVEGGYYFWTQKRMERQQVPFAVSQEGIFTHIKSKGNIDQKQIWGTVEEIDGNEVTIKTENGEQVKIKYNNEKIWRVERYVDEVTDFSMIEEKLNKLLVGEEVQLSQIETNSQGNLSADHLVVIR